jgi:hypothetical protein
MTDIKVDTVLDAAGTGKPNFSTGVTINGAALSTLNLGQYAASSSEPSSPENGSIWWDTANEKIFIYIAGEWKETIGIAAGISWGGARGVFMGREMQNTIDYVDIQTAGNATDFGDITSSRYQAMAFGNATKGLVAGGRNSSYAGINNIEQVTIATTANATDFGDLTQTQRGGGGWSNGTRGGVCGGLGGTASNVISYVTIASAGNATDHGDLNYAPYESDAINDATHCVSGGGFDLNEYANKNTLDYFTMASTGNASDFGDLTTTRSNLGGADDGTYGLFYGGSAPSVNYSNVIEYITVASTGNGTDFGDLSQARAGAKGCGDGTYAVFGGGYTGSNSNVVDRVTVATTGNATDHGDLTVSGQHPAAVSGNAS